LGGQYAQQLAMNDDCILVDGGTESTEKANTKLTRNSDQIKESSSGFFSEVESNQNTSHN